MNLLAKTKVGIMKPVIGFLPKPIPMTFIGSGQVQKVAELLKIRSTKKVFVMTDAFLYQTGLLESMLKSIHAAGIETVVFDGVLPDPTFAIVEEAQRLCVNCDAIVAVGGGSVLDATKAVAAAVANKTSPKNLAGLLKVKRPTLPFIAVPTTAGTGSETTIVAVVSDSVTHQKKQIISPKLVPFAAVLDPDLTVGLPPHTTAFTTIDALTHALEAYLSGYATQETDALAEMAIKTIFENLPKVQETPANKEAREALLIASFMAGMAFTQTYVGYVHAFAHTLGGRYGIPHGLANAVLLPHVMKLYLPVCTVRFAKLADLISTSIPQDNTEQRAKKFVDRLFALNRLCNIPERFDTFPASDIDEVIEKAFQECHGTYPVPMYLSKTQAKELLQKISALQ